MKQNMRRILGVTVFLLLPMSSFAYMDPGSGMLLWQSLVAAIGAVIVFVRNPIKAVKRLLDYIKRK